MFTLMEVHAEKRDKDAVEYVVNWSEYYSKMFSIRLVSYLCSRMMLIHKPSPYFDIRWEKRDIETSSERFDASTVSPRVLFLVRQKLLLGMTLFLERHSTVDAQKVE